MLASKAAVWASALSGRGSAFTPVAAGGLRAFGRHPKHYPKPNRVNRDLPAMKDLTGHLVKTPKKKEWMRQPFPHSKMDDKDERRMKRDVYLFQRSIPPPVPRTAISGCHTKLEGDSTERRWWIVDAKGQAMGKLATQITKVIMGKHKPIYDWHQVLGDFVVVVNADQIHLSGRKFDQKKYRYHTGYPGGLKTVPVSKLLEEQPVEVLRRAVHGMLPKNKLRQERLKLMRIFAGADHPHVNEHIEPLPNFIKATSPWLTPKPDFVPKSEAQVRVFDEDGNPWPELTDNQGNKYTLEEVEGWIEEGDVTFWTEEERKLIPTEDDLNKNRK